MVIIEFLVSLLGGLAFSILQAAVWSCILWPIWYIGLGNAMAFAVPSNLVDIGFGDFFATMWTLRLLALGSLGFGKVS